MKQAWAVFAVLLLIGGCMKILGVGESPEEKATRELTEELDRNAREYEARKEREASEAVEGDGSAQNACRKFRAVNVDASAGVITNDQLIEGLQDVWDSAKYSSVDEVRGSAQILLANVIDGEGIYRATSNMLEACDRIGQ